jgi:hypothetical protein
MTRAALAIALACACSIALSTPVHATDAQVSVTGWGVLVLPVPSGWQQSQKPGKVPTLVLAPANGKGFLVQVSPLRSADGYMPDASATSLRGIVSQEADSAKSQAVEKELPIREIHSGSVHGSYFTATDRAPKPDEFKYMTQGAIGVQGLPVVFTILYNGDPRVSAEPALRMLGAAHKK